MMNSTFVYSYDKLNRLLTGTNGQTGAASIAEEMTYDGRGNIRTLKRDGGAVTTYAYTGNRSSMLTGGLTGNYSYDANGNAVTDRMGMAFTYNYLNLPSTAVKTGTDVAFLYSAEGTKLRKVSKINSGGGLVTTTRDYIKGIEYNNGVIDIIHNAVGYAQKSGTDYVYHYHLTDHPPVVGQALGNTRATLKRGSSTPAVDVVQRDNYSFVFVLKVLSSLRSVTGLGSTMRRSVGGMWSIRWRRIIMITVRMRTFLTIPSRMLIYMD